SASASVLAAVRVWPCAAVPLMVTLPVGPSFTLIMFTVVLPVADRAPPAPCTPELPSLKIQSICTLAGGASELFAYPMLERTEFTRAWVALLLKVIARVPSLFVYEPTVMPERITFPELKLRPPRAENKSCAD